MSPPPGSPAVSAAAGLGLAPSAALSPYDRPSSVAALAMTSNLGALIMLLPPVEIAAFLGDGRYGSGQASALSAIELGGMTCGILATSPWIGRLDRRLWIAIGLVVATAGQLLSIFGQSFAALLGLRALVGLGVGLVYTIAVAGLAATRSPDRSFGFAITANQLSATAVTAIGSWIGLNHGHGPVITILFAFTLLVGLAVPWIPRSTAAAAGQARPVAAGRGSLGRGLVGLAGMFLFLMGIGSVWPILAPIAQSRGVDPAAVGPALAVAGVGGIGAGLLVSMLGTRFGRIGPLTIGALGIAAAMLSLLILHDGAMLMVVAVVIMFLWIFSIPFFLGALSSLEPTGRLTVLSSAMMPFGLAAGQALAATLHGAAHATPTVILAAILLVSALIAVGGGLLSHRSSALPAS